MSVYLVVGFYDDTMQCFSEHVEAERAKDAIAQILDANPCLTVVDAINEELESCGPSWIVNDMSEYGVDPRIEA